MTAAPPSVIDGPSGAILSLGGLEVAPDGSGGLAYLKTVAGVAHVFAAPLAGGVFTAPVELDASLPGDSSRPLVAGSNGGRIVVAFLNGGSLYAVVRRAGGAAWGPPQLLAAGATSPAISASAFGKAYIAFTGNGAGGHDVRLAYFDGSAWSIAPAALDAVAGDDAGTGSGRPSVVAAGDGVAAVAWGEGGHVFVRRVRGTAPSTAVVQVDPPTFGTQTEVAADEPAVSAGGDSSYVDVAFHEILAAGAGTTQSRVLVSRLVASQLQPAAAVDSVGNGGGGADQPQIALGEYGRGFITSVRTDTSDVTAVTAGNNGALTGITSPVNAQPEASAPVVAPGTAGLISTLIAYGYDPGPAGAPDIRVRYSLNGVTLGPEQIVSDPTLGPADPADGLAATGDGRGDAAVAWVQGTAGSRAIVAEQFYWPPSGLSAVAPAGYVNTAQPTLAWAPPTVAWGPIRYAVTLDGTPVGTTTATSLRVPVALADGPHTFTVTATDPAGQTTTMRPAGFFVDHLAPQVALRVTGTLQAGVHVHVLGIVTDTAPPEVPGGSSGIASLTLSFGDGTSMTGVSSRYHAYARPGRYRITLRASDRAGNVGTASIVVRILPKPKPKPKTKPKTKPTHGAARR